MAEGENAMANPPDLAANDQTAVSSGLMMNDDRSGEISGDITTVSKKAPAGAQEEVGEDQQRDIKTKLDVNRQRSENIRKAMVKLSEEKDLGANLASKLFNGPMGMVIKKIPFVSALINRFMAKSNLALKIKTLQKIRGKLKLAKTGAAIYDGSMSWGEAFSLLSETIIIPILLIIIYIPWIIVYIFYKEGPITKTIVKAIKEINKILVPLEKQFQQEQQRKAALADLRGMEISAAREQVQNAA